MSNDGIFTVPECECPLEHSITKLGHCRTCACRELLQVTIASAPVAAPITFFACFQTEHTNGEAHNFDWATYADEQTSYGVCKCGMGEITHSLMEVS